MSPGVSDAIRLSPYLTMAYQDDPIFHAACHTSVGLVGLLEFMVRSNRMAWSEVENLHKIGLPPLVIYRDDIPGTRPAHPANEDSESCEGYRPDDRTVGASCLPNRGVDLAGASPAQVQRVVGQTESQEINP